MEKGSKRTERDLEILARVGRSLLGSIDLDEQLALALRNAVEALGAQRGSVMLLGADGELAVTAAEGLPAEAMSATTRVGDGIAGWVAEHKEPLVLHGGVSDPRFEGVDPTIDSSLSLPLSAQGTFIGVLNITRKSGDLFTEDDLRLASSVADLASLAIEKAQLHSALKEREERVSTLLAAAIGAQEQERTRIAADIHDGFLQDLSALFLRAENARMMLRRGKTEDAEKSINSIMDLLRSEVNSVRDYIFEVRPPSLDEVGLAPTLAEMVERLSEQHNLNGSFVGNLNGPRIDKTFETILYRIAQEALRNVVKHSFATTVTVALQVDEDRVVLSVEDDGKGIEPDSITRPGHFGIMTMRERVELAGGKFFVGSGVSGGTEVRAEIPL